MVEDPLGDYLAEEIAPMIEQHGFTVQSVFGDRMDVGFQYTVGLTERDWPELLVAGFYAPVGGAVLRMAVGRLREQEPRRLTAGMRFTVDLGEGKQVLGRLRRPDRRERVRYGLGVARAYYQRPVRWLMVGVEGWPCPSCTPADRSVKTCSCLFECGWNYCDRASREVTTEPKART